MRDALKDVVRRPGVVEALPALDPYALQFLLCAAAGAAGALALKLTVKGALSWGPVVRAVASGTVLAAFATPALAEKWHVMAPSYVAIIAFVTGVSAQAIVPLIPMLAAAFAKRAARGWAAAVTLPEPASDYPLPGTPPAVVRPHKPSEPSA